MLNYFLILILGKIENSVANERLSPCVDTFKACHGWSRLGYCSSNSKAGFMREYCKSSCNLCAPTDPDYLGTSCRLTFCVHAVLSFEVVKCAKCAKLIKMVNFKLGKWNVKSELINMTRAWKKSESRTPGWRSIHWATRTHGEQGHLTEFS